MRYVPRALITDKLRSYTAAKADHYLTLPSRKTSVQSYRLPSSDEIKVRHVGRGDRLRRFLIDPDQVARLSDEQSLTATAREVGMSPFYFSRALSAISSISIVLSETYYTSVSDQIFI